jgi:hypothetical protein
VLSVIRRGDQWKLPSLINREAFGNPTCVRLRQASLAPLSRRAKLACRSLTVHQSGDRDPAVAVPRLPRCAADAEASHEILAHSRPRNESRTNAPQLPGSVSGIKTIYSPTFCSFDLAPTDGIDLRRGLLKPLSTLFNQTKSISSEDARRHEPHTTLGWPQVVPATRSKSSRRDWE